MSSWLSSDAHAGGSVGILIGVVFLTLGSVISFVKNKSGKVASWRRSIGIFILVSGLISLITGLVFVSRPSKKYNSVQITDISKVIESDTLIHSPVILSPIEVVDVNTTKFEKKNSVETAIHLPSSVKVVNEENLEIIVSLPFSYSVTASVGAIIEGVKNIFVAGKTDENETSENEYNFIFRFIQVQDQVDFVLIERFPVEFKIDNLKHLQNSIEFILQTNFKTLIWKKKTNLNTNG